VLTYHILPHYPSDRPESEATDAVLQRWLQEHVLFLALRDGEAIVVDGEKQLVVG
jgi:dipeptidase E